MSNPLVRSKFYSRKWTAIQIDYGGDQRVLGSMDVASLRCSWVKPCYIIDTDSVYLTL